MWEINYAAAEKEAILNKEMGGFELVENGNYEAVIDEISEKVSKSGIPMVEVWYRIREDVAQKHQGARLGYWLVAQKDSKMFDQKRLLEFAVKHGVNPGTKFNTLGDGLKFISNQKLLITVKVKERPDPDGNMRKNSTVANVKPSQLSAAPITPMAGGYDLNNPPY